MADFTVKPSPGRGRGVFAGRDFPAGAVLFADPVVALDAGDLATIRTTALARYWWHWGGAGAVVFGLRSMINHSAAPNVAHRPLEALGLMEFRALAPIAAGDELSVDYGAEPG